MTVMEAGEQRHPGSVAVVNGARGHAIANGTLQDADERFRKVFEEGPVGIVIVTDDLRLLDVNEAFARIVGYERDELIGRADADITHPGDHEKDAYLARQVFEGRIPSYRIEKRYRKKDGGMVWAALTATVLHDAAGKPQYGLGIVEDIAKHKRAELLMLKRNQRLAADLVTSLRELKLSRARIIASADLERRRIERDLHDGAQHRLVALRVRIGLAHELLAKDPTQGDKLLDELSDEVDAALEEVRQLAKGVYPSLLADRGLVEALRAAARNSPLPVTVRAKAVGRCPEDVETAVYFSCIEALQNAAKHAGPQTSVSVSLTAAGELRFEVSDDGGGFAVHDTPTGSGLVNMSDRVEAVGGRLTVESAPGEGTTIAGVIPLR